MFKLKSYILEIARTGSFSQAAANLYVSQPSLSASVKRLEARIGEPLFDRSCHPAQLTQCGEEYLRAARQIELAEEDFAIFLEEYRSCSTGKLIVGGSNLNISFVLPPLLRRFVSAYPKISVEPVESSIDRLQQMLWDGQVDLVLDSCEMDPEKFHAQRYKEENLILAVPEEFSCNEAMAPFRLSWEDIRGNRHRDPQFPALPLELLRDVPFIALTPETDTRQRMQAIFLEADFTPNIVLSFNQQSTAFNMACANLGVTLISDTLIKNAQFRPHLHYYKISGGYRHIKLFWKAGRRISYAMRAFLQTAQQ